MTNWICIVLLLNLSIAVAYCNLININDDGNSSSGPNNLSEQEKLDLIIESLKSIESKQDELAENITKLRDELSPLNRSNYNNDDRPNTPQTIQSNDEEFDQSKLDRLVRQSIETSPYSKALFRSNKLATSMNSIPSSSFNWDDADSNKGTTNWPLSGSSSNSNSNNNNNKESSISGHHNSAAMFELAMENLSSILKEQLASFRLTLNKLTSRIVDHSYQYNLILNQLALVREECSLAAASSTATATATKLPIIIEGNNNNNNAVPTESPEAAAAAINPSYDNRRANGSNGMNAEKSKQQAAAAAAAAADMNTNAIRGTDDIAATVQRGPPLALDGLIRVINRSACATNEASSSRPVRPPSWSQSSDHLADGDHAQMTIAQTSAATMEPKSATEIRLLERLTGMFINETKSLSKRLDEIDSVSKQSALLLGKLESRSMLMRGCSLPVSVLDFTNSNQSAMVEATKQPANKTIALRWFPGSRVPGRQNLDLQMANSGNNNNATNHRQASTKAAKQRMTTERKCISKTSLIRPAGCRQLREAGANCTGQYYVFVRGIIRHVYCDMSQDDSQEEGGWTVILRRIDKSLDTANPDANDADANAGSTIRRQVNPLMEAFKATQLDFNLSWSNYKSGFGQLNDWAEFFIGLDMLHQLTWPAANSDDNNNNNNNNQKSPRVESQSELQVDLEFNSSKRVQLRFDSFSVANEESQFELRISACNSSSSSTEFRELDICRPLTMLNGSRFYARDNLTTGSSGGNDDDDEDDGHGICSFARDSLASSGSGWWLANKANCSPDFWLPLTMPIVVGGNKQQPTSGGGGGDITLRKSQHFHWPGYAQEPLKRIVMKVRNKRRPSFGS